MGAWGHVIGYISCYMTLGTCYLACYVPFNIPNMHRLFNFPWYIMGAKHDKVRKKGRLKRKKCKGTLILIALTFKH
jgi:hypothetical protein